jgi:TM2 domain-containing membrane protein YozV
MERISEKNAIYAYFFSIILPGLGHIYLNHKKRGLSILMGAFGLSLTLTFLLAFPLNWIIMVAYWIWQVIDAFFLYKTEKKVSKNPLHERNSGFSHF